MSLKRTSSSASEAVKKQKREDALSEKAQLLMDNFNKVVTAKVFADEINDNNSYKHGVARGHAYRHGILNIIRVIMYQAVQSDCLPVVDIFLEILLKVCRSNKFHITSMGIPNAIDRCTCCGEVGRMVAWWKVERDDYLPQVWHFDNECLLKTEWVVTIHNLLRSICLPSPGPFGVGLSPLLEVGNAEHRFAILKEFVEMALITNVK